MPSHQQAHDPVDAAKTLRKQQKRINMKVILKAQLNLFHMIQMILWNNYEKKP